MQNMEIFEYIATFNRQDSDKLAEREQSTLDRWDDQDKAKPFRTFHVDEDNLARFVELVPMVNAGRDWFQTNSKSIDEGQGRLDAAKAGEYLPRDEFMALVQSINARKARAKDFSPRYQAAKAEMQVLLATEGTALWARWYQIEDHSAHLKDYLEADLVSFWDAEDFDDRIIMVDAPEVLWDEVQPGVLYKVQGHSTPVDQMDCLRDKHMAEMSHEQIEGNENPWLGGFWDWRQERACKQATRSQFYEDQSMQALLVDDSLCPF